VCTRVLEKDPNNIDALCNKAETYIHNEQFDEGKLYNTSDYVFINKDLTNRQYGIFK